ncbi:MAG TPA: GTPase domain-containing protein [Candidatus Binatia bacterium]|nr:GTPase domain-containing protein [Candidatus Binatia bacterium]
MTLEERLERLERAAGSVREIGLETEGEAAAAVVRRARERVGFPGAAYVLAFAGGTGVGKSSLLNALAGEPVSAVRATRPTTEQPLAWVAEDRRAELAGLLTWLGVRQVIGHADAELASVAIVDLPDVDSVRTEHRALVDELLPRIDSIAWVVDPEKYDDERLHAYLRSLDAHADRMRFVLNKADRLTDAERVALETDLRRRLAASGLPDARIHVVSAATGAGVAELRSSLAADADAKAIVADKLAADAREAHAALAHALGLDAAYRPLLTDARRDEALREAVDGALRIVDPPGVARQVQAAVLNRARRSGGSLLGRAVALLGWMTGQRRRRADPAGYLRDWRGRGALGRVVNPVHAALVEAAQGVPAPSRPKILRALGADAAEASVSRALDEVARDAGSDLHVPGSLLWPAVGVVQLLVGAVFVLAVAWYATLYIAGGAVPVATLELPAVGPVPMPLLLLAGSVVVSALIGFLLSLHAGWIGRRRGQRLAARVRTAVAGEIDSAVMSGLARVETVRRELAGGRDE